MSTGYDKHFEAWRSKMKTEALGHVYNFCYSNCCSGFISKLRYNLKRSFLDGPRIFQVKAGWGSEQPSMARGVGTIK